MKTLELLITMAGKFISGIKITAPEKIKENNLGLH